jgi:Integrase core domain
LLDLCQVVGAQLGVERAERLCEPLAPAGADKRDDVIAARERPGDRDLRDRRALGVREPAERLDEREVTLEVLAREPWPPARLLILGRRHLQSVLRSYIQHYNTERPHRGLALRPPEATHLDPPTGGAIQRRDHLGGLLHEYYRAAA